MYDSPDVRDSHRAAQRIEQLEAKLTELDRKLEYLGPATIQLIESVKRLSLLCDALSKGVEFLFDRGGATIPEFCEHRERFAEVNAQPGPCECFACRAERHDKQQPSPEQAAAGASSDPVDDAVGRAIANALQQLVGPAGFTVEQFSGDDAEEFLRRAQRDGMRAAKEWLGLQQLKRGAQGGQDRPEGRE